MTITETDTFEQAGNISSTDIPDGLAVSDMEGKKSTSSTRCKRRLPALRWCP